MIMNKFKKFLYTISCGLFLMSMFSCNKENENVVKDEYTFIFDYNYDGG